MFSKGYGRLDCKHPFNKGHPPKQGTCDDYLGPYSMTDLTESHHYSNRSRGHNSTSGCSCACSRAASERMSVVKRTRGYIVSYPQSRDDLDKKEDVDSVSQISGKTRKSNKTRLAIEYGEGNRSLCIGDLLPPYCEEETLLKGDNSQVFKSLVVSPRDVTRIVGSAC